MRLVVFYGCILIFMFACNSDPLPTAPPVLPVADTSPTKAYQIETVNGQPIALEVIHGQTKLYAEPNQNSAVLKTVELGDTLYFTNQITSQNEEQIIANITYNEPWLRVFFDAQKMAWVYAGNISLEAVQSPLLEERVLLQRAANFFGKNIAQLISIYTKEKKNIQTLPAFRLLYTRASTLQDSIGYKLNNWTKVNASSSRPNFFWLNDLLDGLLLHDVAEEGKFYLFRDLKKWQQYSQKTAAKEDDNFIEVLLSVYQSDSIEYFFYDWQMPLQQGKICSTLGSGVHRQVLDKMEIALDSNSYFEPEIEELKTAMINDISLSAYYWLPLENILSELDTILIKDYKVLNQNDKTELKNRKQLIVQYEKNQIVVNLFEGE